MYTLTSGRLGRLGLALLLLSGLAIGGAVCAGANPLPMCATFVHVQPIDPSFCQTSTITLCSQIVQHTERDGPLEFDVFIWIPFPQRFYDLQLQVAWPESWNYIGWEPCHDGEGAIELQAHGAALSVVWPDCPVVETQVFLAARLMLDVNGFGEMRTNAGQGWMHWECPEQYEVPVDALGGAQAGVECAYCFQDCRFEGPSRPRLTPQTLVFELPQGESDQQMIEATVVSWEPDPITFACTESWMDLDVQRIDWDHYHVTVTASAQGLEPGDYQGWVRADGGCRDCARVDLTVLSQQGVSDEDESAGGSETSPSWGEVKSLYRP